MKAQTVITADREYVSLDDYFTKTGAKRLLLVCDVSISYLRLDEYFKNLCARKKIQVIRFSDFQPNPIYDSVVKGVDLFRRSRCDMIVAVGGGSAMDVAKCIKLFCNMDEQENYLKQPIIPNDVKLLAVPTTAGTGSEATKYAVIYYNGEKQSVTDEGCIPDSVLMDGSVLKTLPIYQKKSTMLDALCHAIESFWSVNSTAESKKYSRKALESILKNKEGYISNNDASNANMLIAADTAGKAINITQTTAGHAMCYKLTSLYGIAHGHAAALCVRKLFPWMIENTDKCIDPRGEKYLKNTFEEIAEAMGCVTPAEASKKFDDVFRSLDLSVPSPSETDYNVLKESVNIERLRNHPIALSPDIIDELYHSILN